MRDTLTVNPIRGRRPVLQNCTTAELEIDPGYQRSTENASSQALIRSIAREWDWRLCQPLMVARRSDEAGEHLFVVDGQHRLAAARLRHDIIDLPCVITDYQDRKDEVATFVELNRRRRALGALDLFKAEVARGEAGAVQIVQLLEAARLQLAPHTNYASWKPGVLANISGLQRALREYGPDVTGRALKILSEAFRGEVLRYAGTIFPGIAAAVAARQQKANDAVLVTALAAPGQAEWSKRIAAMAAEKGCHGRIAAATVIKAAASDARAVIAGPTLKRAPAPTSAIEVRPAAPAPASKAAPVAPAADGRTWCDQCEERVSTTKAAACASAFCKGKAMAA